VLPCCGASASQTRLASEIVQSPDSQQPASHVLPDDSPLPSRAELLLCFAGPAGRATSRRWGHQLTQVFRAAAAGFPGRTGHLSNPDTKLTASAPHRPHPVMTVVSVAPQAASGIHEQPAVSDRLQESHSQSAAHPQLPASQLQQSPACATASLEQPLGQSLYQPQTHGRSSSEHLPPSTSASDQVSQPMNTGKTAGGSVPAPQLQCSLAAAPLVSVSRQDQDLADAEQQPEGSQSASAVPEVKANRQALAQTDQHASTRQALPPPCIYTNRSRLFTHLRSPICCGCSHSQHQYLQRKHLSVLQQSSLSNRLHRPMLHLHLKTKTQMYHIVRRHMHSRPSLVIKRCWRHL